VSTDRLLRTVDFILPRDWDRSAGKEASVQGCKSHMQS
jgi:ribonuclease R